MTQFETLQQKAALGEVRVPEVMTRETKVPFFGYQLSVHLANLKLMAVGMKFRGITFTQIKKYYGLTGRSAKECIPQLERILENYKNN